MDTLTFISSVIHDLAWPVTTLIVLAVFIRYAPYIARLIKTLRYKDVEVTFREDFLKARTLVDEIKIVHASQEAPELKNNDEILKLAEIDPAVAVFKVWQKLEAKIIQLIQHNGLMRFTNPEKFIRRLSDLGKITENEAILFKRLNEIRNTVVHLAPYGHRQQLSIAEVIEFKDFVDTFVQRLESIRQEPGYINEK